MRNRNALCSCNSGYKYKHCCGSPSDDVARPSPDELEILAVAADDEGLALGEEPKQRAFMNVMRMVQRLGLDGVVLVGAGSPPIMRRIHAANNRMFRRIDMREGGVHLGFFMFRDLFAQLSVPLIMGMPEIDLVSQLNLSEDQKRWMSSDSESMARFEDQALDLFDFAYGWMEFDDGCSSDGGGKDLIYRSHTYLEAAAATATCAYDFRGTVQSALIGAELALKAGLLCCGVEEEKIRRVYGHNISKAAQSLGGFKSSFDVDRVVRAVSSFPDFAKSRYVGEQPTRLETGHILMKAQYIASEVTRSFSDRDLRKGQRNGYVRRYPE